MLEKASRHSLRQHAPDDILCFACLRNEAVRLPYFLSFYRALGVDRFYIIDNASEDSTHSILAAEPDVELFYTDESYAASKCGVDWLNELLSKHGKGHWTLTVDADELLVYPGCEQFGLKRFTRYLDHKGWNALPVFLLDMYARRPISQVHYRAGAPFLEFCRYFDPDSYHERDALGMPLRGGPRYRLFWAGKNRGKPAPVLGKIPLVRWAERLRFEASTHIISHVRLAEVSGVLQHFKLFSDFYGYTQNESQREEHWDAAAQYKAYWDTLKEDETVTAYYEGSQAYRDSQQLVNLGLARVPEKFWQEV